MSDPGEPVDPSAPAPDPTPEPIPIPAAAVAGAPPASSAGAAAMAVPALSAFDAAARLVLGGAAAVVVIVLLGLLIGAWSLDPFGIVMLVLALIAAGGAYTAQAMAVRVELKPWQAFAQLVGGALATVLAGLSLVEMIGDLDDMDDYGGIVGFVLGIVLLGASAAMLWGAARGATLDLRPREAGARLAGIGAGLVLLAWVLHLTVGFWAFGPAVWGIGALILAAVLLLSGGAFGLPAWTAWVAFALGVFAAWVALGQWGALMDVGAERVELGLEDYLPFLLYVVGILLVIAGAALTATGGRLAIPGGGTAGDTDRAGPA
jgi:hypothetical protein